MSKGKGKRDKNVQIARIDGAKIKRMDLDVVSLEVLGNTNHGGLMVILSGGTRKGDRCICANVPLDLVVHLTAKVLATTMALHPAEAQAMLTEVQAFFHANPPPVSN